MGTESLLPTFFPEISCSTLNLEREITNHGNQFKEVSHSDKIPRIPVVIDGGSSEARSLEAFRSKISAPSLLLGSQARGEVTGSHTQSSQGNNVDLRLAHARANLGLQSQNLGIRTQVPNPAISSGGKSQWRPISSSSLVNQVISTSELGISSSQNLGIVPNVGPNSLDMNINHNVGPNLEMEFPTLLCSSQNQGRMDTHGQNQGTNGTVSEIGQDNNSDVGVQRPSWLGAVLNNSTMKWNNILHMEKNNYTIVKKQMLKVNDHLIIPDDVVQRGSQQWKDVVVGYFFDNRLDFRFMERYLRGRWRWKGRIRINADKNMFFLRFTSDEDRKMVLEEGNIFINGRVFLLREWKADIEMERRGCKTLPIWARFWDLPKFMWNREGFSYIASAIGEPLFTDKITMEMTKMGYARMCIEVNSSFDFTDKLKFKAGLMEFEVDVEYQWIPPKCKNCNSFGHYFHECKETRRNEETHNKNTGDEEQNEETVIETMQAESDTLVQGKDKEAGVGNSEADQVNATETEVGEEEIGNKEKEAQVKNGNTVAEYGNSEGIEIEQDGKDSTEMDGYVSDGSNIKEGCNVSSNEGENIVTNTLGNNSEHIQQNKDSNVEVTLVTEGTCTAVNQKKTVEGSGITRPVVTSVEKQTSVEINLEADRNENKGGGRRIMGRYEVVHTQKERDNRGRTRSGVVLQTKNTYSPLNQKENEESIISFNEDIEEYDEDGSSQPDEDDIPFLNGVPNILKSYSASKEKGAKVKNQNSANKVKGIIANKHQKAMVTPVKEPTNVKNIAIRGKGHNQRR